MVKKFKPLFPLIKEPLHAVATPVATGRSNENDSKLVEVLTDYSRRARHYLQRFNAIQAATKVDAADTTKTKPRATKPAHQRYRLSDRLGQDVLQKITACYVAGESLHELAAQYGVARSSLSRHMRREGIGIRQQGLTDEQKCDILRLRAQGLGIRTIAKRLGCAYGTTRLFLIDAEKTDD